MHKENGLFVLQAEILRNNKREREKRSLKAYDNK
jgi:hypothetical protein